MKRAVGSLLFSMVLTFSNATAQAQPVNGAAADRLSEVFFELMRDYPSVLQAAVKLGLVESMAEVVVVGSPWYKSLLEAKKSGDFTAPHAVGEIPYYPFPFLSFMLINEQFHLQKDHLHIYQSDETPTLFQFSVDGAWVTVLYNGGKMKFYGFNANQFRDSFLQQLM